MNEAEFMPMAIEFAKNHTLMVTAWVAVFVMVIYTFVKSATSKVKVVTNPEMTALINKEDAVIVDLRSVDEFKRGHVIGSVQLTPSDIKKKNIGQIEQHKSSPVVVVDANGLGAANIGEELFKQGFSRVYALKEGIAGWRSANLPLVK
ncbi:rhodanese-like domain-containing protein [Conservatibacter flavescens]|uniref:Rhodanese-like domain-containing protein n=1 Tax=Conservatibacter flavescens TaxID=28161 RepID=A0A2M8RZM3_9PAST|nr:rhodanese-like domain-containing protein [Conservatibacter flavescens]PJG84329.1 rhodanese-like domain-containing protein [Conservatibacter flavescens]